MQDTLLSTELRVGCTVIWISRSFSQIKGQFHGLLQESDGVLGNQSQPLSVQHSFCRYWCLLITGATANTQWETWSYYVRDHFSSSKRGKRVSSRSHLGEPVLFAAPSIWQGLGESVLWRESGKDPDTVRAGVEWPLSWPLTLGSTLELGKWLGKPTVRAMWPRTKAPLH